MRRRLARLLMSCAVRWSRHPWAGEAMRAEFCAAEEDGQGLRFAVGCAWASVKERIDGRIAIAPGWARLAVAIVVMVPMAVFEFGCGYLGIQLVVTGQDHYYASLISGGATEQAMAEAYRRAASLMTTLLLTMAMCETALAWSLIRGHGHRARQMAACVVVAGLTMSTLIMALGVNGASLALYLGIPVAQWCVVSRLVPDAAR